MSNTAFYEARAAEARSAAAASALANVRDRCLRAAAAWDAMAQRAARMDRHREEEAVRRILRDDPSALLLPATAYARPQRGRPPRG